MIIHFRELDQEFTNQIKDIFMMTTFFHHDFASNYFGIIYDNEQWTELLSQERKPMDMCRFGQQSIY